MILRIIFLIEILSRLSAKAAAVIVKYIDFKQICFLNLYLPELNIVYYFIN